MSEIKQDEEKYEETYFRNPYLNLYQILLLNALNEGAKTKSLVEVPEICRGQGNSYGLARFAEYNDLIVITLSKQSKQFFVEQHAYKGQIYHVREISPGVDLRNGFIIDAGVKLEDIKNFKYALVTGISSVENTYIKF